MPDLKFSSKEVDQEHEVWSSRVPVENQWKVGLVGGTWTNGTEFEVNGSGSSKWKYN